MSLGSILVALALALVCGAYLARPFRIADGIASLDRAIEAWVAQVRAAGRREGESEEEAPGACPRCGRRVGPDDRFCPGCGARLPGGAG